MVSRSHALSGKLAFVVALLVFAACRDMGPDKHPVTASLRAVHDEGYSDVEAYTGAIGSCSVGGGTAGCGRAEVARWQYDFHFQTTTLISPETFEWAVAEGEAEMRKGTYFPVTSH